MNWNQEMGWKGEHTRIIQAQPSWKVRLLSGSYCSHEIRIEEGRPDASQFLIVVRKTFPTEEQDSYLQLQMDERVVKMQLVVWNQLQILLVFIKRCLQLGLAVLALGAVLVYVHWRERGRRKH